MIDGGYLRVIARQSAIDFNPDLIEAFSQGCRESREEIHRVLYYDCAPYNGEANRPISGTKQVFRGSDDWLQQLARKDLFAVRRGVLKFRGYKPKRIPMPSRPALKDEDFKPDFEQKGVDMRIGLDIASFSEKRSVERILLVSGDTDCVPAMKYARIAGLQVVLAHLPGTRLAAELLHHSDYVRTVPWPAKGHELESAS